MTNWLKEPCTFDDENIVAFAYFEQSDYAIYLNPTDKRGYRSIVRLIDNDRMNSTLNRTYTSSERIGLSLAMALVTEAYTRIVPIAQNAVAGNNAHSFDAQTGVVQLGRDEEPIFLHGHVFGRGNPKATYIEDVQLDGPVPGLVFDMRAQTLNESGNDRKLNWQAGEMKKVIRRLRQEIEAIYDIYKAHGLTIVTRQRSIDIYIVRHGETDWNVEKRLQGHTDIFLNANGEQQARQLQEKFAHIDFSRVYSSDLARARSTAEFILASRDDATIIQTPLLREKYMAAWEGRSLVELGKYLKQTRDSTHLNQEDFLSFTWDESVESYWDVYQRLKTLIRSIFISSPEINNPILFCSHGGMLRSILCRLDYRPGVHWQVPNGSYLKLKAHADGRIVITETEGVKPNKLPETTTSF